MELYVVTTGSPGPGAAALLDEAPTIPDAGLTHGRALALADAKAAVAGACEFVEVETEAGKGVGRDHGVDWEPYAEGLHRLGPFMAPLTDDQVRDPLAIQEAVQTLLGLPNRTSVAVKVDVNAEVTEVKVRVIMMPRFRLADA